MVCSEVRTAVEDESCNSNPEYTLDRHPQKGSFRIRSDVDGIETGPDIVVTGVGIEIEIAIGEVVVIVVVEPETILLENQNHPSEYQESNFLPYYTHTRYPARQYYDKPNCFEPPDYLVVVVVEKS